VLSESETPIETWSDYDTASESFQNALDQLALSWPKYSRLQEKLGISFSDFPAYIENLIKQSESLEETIVIEREAAEAKVTDAILKGIEAAKSRDRWKTAAIVEFIIASGLGIGLGLSLIF